MLSSKQKEEKYLEDLESMGISAHMFKTNPHHAQSQYGEDRSHFYLTQPLSPMDAKLSSEMMHTYHAQNNISGSKHNTSTSHNPVIDIFSPKNYPGNPLMVSKAQEKKRKKSSRLMKHKLRNSNISNS